MTSQGQSIAAKAVEAARVAFNKDPKTIIVPPAIQAMQYEGIEKVLAELGLKRSSTKRCIYNNKVMKKKTKRTYKKHFEGKTPTVTSALVVFLRNHPNHGGARHTVEMLALFVVAIH